MSKSHLPPDIKKIFKTPPSAREISESYDRARRAKSRDWPDRLKPEDTRKSP